MNDFNKEAMERVEDCLKDYCSPWKYLLGFFWYFILPILLVLLSALPFIIAAR